MKTYITAFIGLLLVMVLFSFILAWPVMMLWNGCLVPAVEGVKEIGWLQAWGLQFLVNMLFKLSVTKKD
jgi:hypothetical protein